jgi:hypothetical protein
MVQNVADANDLVANSSWRYPPLNPPTPVCGGCRALVRLREDQVCARTAAANQLWAMLGNYWPGPGTLFCSLASATALAFVTAYRRCHGGLHLTE